MYQTKMETAIDGETAGSSNRRPPALPGSFFKFPVRARLKAVQQYISSFEYRRGPHTSFNSHKSRPLARIMDTAKMMIYNPQPIKCVEAVFLALYLTAGIAEVERIPLGFKSELHGQVHQHLVLLVRHNGRFGAFGISRQHDLMNKDLEFESISSIVEDYKRAYEQSLHNVLRIRVGLPVEHNVESFNFICWRYLSLDPSVSSWDQCSEALERHAQAAKKLWERWLLDGQRENKRADLFPKDIIQYSVKDSTPTNKLSGFEELELRQKVVKRRLAPDERGRSCIVKKRQALREIRSLESTSNQSLAFKSTNKSTEQTQVQPPSARKRPKELHLAVKQCSRCRNLSDASSLTKSVSPMHKKNCKKKALKCLSLELFSVSSRRLGMHLEKSKPKANPHQPRKVGKNLYDRNLSQRQVLTLPLKVVSSRPPLCKRNSLR